MNARPQQANELSSVENVVKALVWPTLKSQYYPMNNRMAAVTLIRIVALLATLWLRPATADELTCGSLENAYGPFDYTNPISRTKDIPVVERYHFNADVEQLRQGQSGVYIMGDLDYTLRAVPNHHRALNAVARFELMGGDMHGFRSAECYFDRALRFKPDDGNVYLIYGNYLFRKHEYVGAEANYKRALSLLANGSEAHYNLGLLYAETKDYERARQEAATAYRAGYPLQGLKNKLIRLGVWRTEDERQAQPSTPAPESDSLRPKAAKN